MSRAMKGLLSKHSILSGLVGVLILGFCYAIVGRLALLLAIPPGYATAIFPPAGIAVAALLIWGYRLAPGVFIGSLMLNIWVTMAKEPLTLSGVEVAVGAAAGASLQALAGAWLIRRFSVLPITLSRERDIIWFMLMAGPLACLVNASFGVTSLYATGTISLAEFTYSWFTWWVGDTIGVLVTVPIVFILFARPRKLWWRRRNFVAIPLIVMLTTVIALFFWASKLESERTQIFKVS